MSLTTYLMDTGETDLNSILREHLPKQALFKTNKACIKAFNGYYKTLVPLKLEDTDGSKVLGKAFDYAFRIMVSKRAGVNIDVLWHTRAEKGLESIRIAAWTDEQRKFIAQLSMRFNEAMLHIWYYLNNKGIGQYSRIAKPVYLLAQLDSLPTDISFNGVNMTDYFKPIDTELLHELEGMMDCFYDTWLFKIVSPGDTVINSPTFGTIPKRIRGAVADIFCGSTLYEIKSSIHQGYNWRDVAQIWSYYLFDCLLKISGGQEGESLIPSQITVRNLSLYRARHGIMETYDLSNTSKSELEDTLIKLDGFLLTGIGEQRIHEWVYQQHYLTD